MIDSVLLYSSGLLALAGLGMLLRKRTRRLGTRVLIAGVAGMAIALFWPASEKRASATAQIDRAMPVWEFDERHEIDVAATPAQIFEAIRAVRADDIRLFNTLPLLARAHDEPSHWKGFRLGTVSPGDLASRPTDFGQSGKRPGGGGQATPQS